MDILQSADFTLEQKEFAIAARIQSQGLFNEAEQSRCIHYAATNGANDLLSFLIDLGFKADAVDSDGSNALLKLASEEEGSTCKWDRRTISMLITRISIEAEEPGTGNNAFHLAAINGHVTIVEELVKFFTHNDGQVLKSGLKARRRWDLKQPLHLAAQDNSPGVAKMLVDAGAVLDTACSEMRTPLHLASFSGHSEVVNVLLGLSSPAFVNRKMMDGSTALHLAVSQGHLDVVRRILKYQHISANQKDELSYTPLLKAVQKGHRDIVDLLRSALFSPPKNAYMLQACQDYTCTVTDFFRLPDYAFHVPIGYTLHATMYGTNPQDKTKFKVTTNIKDVRPPRSFSIDYPDQTPEFRWLDLPINNIAWMETLIAKSLIEAESPVVEDYRHLMISLGKTIQGARLHSRHMKPTSWFSWDTDTTEMTAGFICMPFLSFASESYQRRITDAIYYARAPLSPMNRMITKEDALCAGYALHDRHDIHLGRTIDQYRYPAMDTTKRDKDQVISRYFRRHLSEIWQPTARNSKENGLFTIDQLWLCILPGLVITCLPEDNTLGRDNRKYSIVDISTLGRKICSIEDFVMAALNKYLGFFDDGYQYSQSQMKFFGMFEATAAELAERAGELLSSFIADVRRVTYWLQKQSLQEEIDGEDTSQDQEKSKSSTFFVNRLIDISQETQLHFECVDVDDELSTLHKVLQQQEAVLHEFWELQLSDEPPGEIHKSFHEWVDQRRKILEEEREKIDRVQGQISDVEKILSELLNMKPRYATAIEARFARDQAEDTSRQGQILMVFTIVTIIFLPLSFLAAFFAINISAFPHDENDELPLGWVLKYLLGIGLAVSIPLIAAAFLFGDFEAWKKRLFLRKTRATAKIKTMHATTTLLPPRPSEGIIRRTTEGIAPMSPTTPRLNSFSRRRTPNRASNNDSEEKMV